MVESPNISPSGRRTLRIGTFNISLVEEPVGPDVSLDTRLAHQFVYFKDQFLEAASSLGIAVPLDIVEDKSGHIYPFLQASGPKYIFQIMQGNMHNVHLLRCALSVLIITTTLLRKRILVMEANDARNHSHKPNLKKEWAKQALSKFCDSVTMESCITILISTYNPVLQELTINLMATLIAVSEDAIRQMLLAPNSRFSSSQAENNQKVLTMHLKKLNSRLSTADTTNTDSRRHSLMAGSMVLPTAVVGSSEFRKSLMQRERATSMRQFKAMDAADDGNGKVMEEYNSCLSNILSVVLMQKNRQLIMAACADVIQAMAKNASAELCEIIARTPTCPLPMVEIDRHLTAKKKQQKSTPINPLGNKIVEWAGLKIPLKFLQKYHSLYTAMAHRSSMEADDETTGLSLRASTSQIKEEYTYAHNSALLAVSYLIAGSKAVAEEVMELPGAVDLMQLAVNVYASQHNNVVDAVILNAVNTLQLEKQRRRKALEKDAPPPLEHAMSTRSLRSPSNARSPILPAMERGRASRQSTATRKASRKADKRPTSTSGGDEFPWATATINAAPARVVDPAQPMGLSESHTVTFGESYVEETEKGRLYLMRQADKVTRERGEATEFTKSAAEEMRGTVKAPIQAPQSVDSLLEVSLKAIDANTEESILQRRSADQAPAYAQRLGLTKSADANIHGGPSFTSYYKDSSSTVKLRPSTADADQKAEALQHGLSATRDFFGKMPAVPFIPKRIEPKDCIHPAEDLEKIRQKFQLIAQNAVAKIKQEGIVREGRNTVSIEERARRVYSPKKLPALRNTQAPTTAPTSISPGASSIELAPLTVDGPDMQPSLSRQMRGDSDRFQMEGGSEEQTPAWNSISTTEAGYFGFKFDNADLEEQDLFENFKPIFDYTPKPETADKKPTTANTANSVSGKLFENSVLAPPKPFMEASADPLL